MTPIIITTHAAHRWIERINPRATFDQAIAEIEAHTRAIQVAAEFGCHYVRLGNGARLVLDGARVTTVLSRGMGIPPAMVGAVDLRLDLAMLGGGL